MACSSCGKSASQKTLSNDKIQVMDESGNMIEVFEWQIQYNEDGSMEIAKSLFENF